MENKKHGDVIIKYKELDAKLKPYGLYIVPWGRIAIAEISGSHRYLVNDIDSIEEVEKWVEGFLYGISLQCTG